MLARILGFRPSFLSRTGQTCALLMLVALGNTSAHAADKRPDAPAANSAPSAATRPSEGFEAFQVILERNIFNPNRVGRTRATVDEKPPRIDEISLVGTMQYDKGLVAFFESSNAAYRKALQEGEFVGEFKVQRISATGVELLRDEKIVPLNVAQQLRRVEGEEWVIATAAPARTDASAAGPAGARNDSAPAEIPADASDVLKRLLKKRDKQLK